MKKIKFILISLLVAGVFSFAFFNTVKAEDSLDILYEETTSEQTIDHMLFKAEDNIIIDETVNGDVYCLGNNVTISGRINGDVFCVAESIIINGTINGDARLLASKQLLISGKIEKSLTILTKKLLIDDEGSVESDILGFSSSIKIKGQVGRDVNAISQELFVSGTISRDVSGHHESIVIDSGTISGNLKYTGENDPKIYNDGFVFSVDRTEPENESETKGTPQIIGEAIASFIYSLISIGIIAVLLALLLPNVFEKASRNFSKSPALVIITGLIAVGALPVTIILLLVSYVGITSMLFAVLIWILLSVMGYFFTAHTIGKAVFKSKQKPVVNIIAGISILIAVGLIPYVNFLAFLAVSVVGLGLSLTYLYDVIKSQKAIK